jgi:hypothetical protein
MAISEPINMAQKAVTARRSQKAALRGLGC